MSLRGAAREGRGATSESRLSWRARRPCHRSVATRRAAFVVKTRPIPTITNARPICPPGDPPAREPGEQHSSHSHRDQADDHEDRREPQTEDEDGEEPEEQLAARDRGEQDGQRARIRQQSAGDAEPEQDAEDSAGRASPSRGRACGVDPTRGGATAYSRRLHPGRSTGGPTGFATSRDRCRRPGIRSRRRDTPRLAPISQVEPRVARTATSTIPLVCDSVTNSPRTKASIGRPRTPTM